MLTFEQIYDSIPFEDEQGNIIPHDKVAKMAAEEYQYNNRITIGILVVIVFILIGIVVWQYFNYVV